MLAFQVKLTGNSANGRLLKDQQMPEEQNGTFFLNNGILVRIKMAVIR